MSEKNGEERMEMEEALEMALQRVVNEKQLKYVPQQHQLLTLARQKERLLATQILANKELHYPRDREDAAAESEEDHLDLKIDAMQKALLNHRIVKSTLQSVAFNIQMQKTVRDMMQKTDVDETMDQFPEKGTLLSHCSSNLHACKELASVMKQKSDLEEDIFKLQMKYLSLLKAIREKWEALQNKIRQPQEENTALTHLQKKMKGREGRIQLLVTMIQGLITSSNFLWGASNYYLQVMLLCDSVARNLDTSKQYSIMKEIAKIHAEQEDKENIQGPRQTLITESIKQKK